MNYLSPRCLPRCLSPKGLSPVVGRKGLTLIEMVVTIALMGIFLSLLSFHLVNLSNLWLSRSDDDFFEQHVDGVVLFLNKALEASEGQMGGEEAATTAAVSWQQPPGWSELDDPLLAFRQEEAPALLAMEGSPLPAIRAYLYFDKRDGLSILWYSELQAEEVEAPGDLRRTPVSPWVSQMEYAYYDIERDEWNIYDEPMEDESGAFMLPDFLRLKFSHETYGERIRSILIPHASAEIPLF